MKTLKTIIAAVLCLVAVNVHAQTADEIIAKYVAAMGGAAKLGSINSLKMEGSIQAQGMDIPITLTTLNKKGIRMDLEIMGSANYQLANTSKGWRFFPVQGDAEPSEMSEAELKSLQDQMDLTDKLLNAKALGLKVEYVGKESVDGAPAYKLKVTKPSGEESYTYIDEKTAFQVKRIGKREINGSEVEVVTTFKDIKQTAEGFWYPYTIDSSIQGTISFSKITVNGAVDEKIFTP
ncbi:MAG: hypothetical protein QM687_05670 [Ferruginibacter sp.]